MRFFQKKYVFLPLIVFSVSFFSCASRINGTISADGSASLTVNMSLEPRMTTLIRSLSAAGGRRDSQNVIDGFSISQSMNESGLVSASLRNTGPSAVEGTILIRRINEYGFFVFEQGRCLININRGNGSQMLENLSADITDYLNALMAPIATGEEMSKTEYLDLVASFYNRNISDEIALSRVRASLEFPGVITGVTGGTSSGRMAEFDIPLLDLLVLETPLVYEVRWR